jgi:hypothetical protein
VWFWFRVRGLWLRALDLGIWLRALGYGLGLWVMA